MQGANPSRAAERLLFRLRLGMPVPAPELHNYHKKNEWFCFRSGKPSHAQDPSDNSIFPLKKATGSFFLQRLSKRMPAFMSVWMQSPQPH